MIIPDENGIINTIFLIGTNLIIEGRQWGTDAKRKERRKYSQHRERSKTWHKTYLNAERFTLDFHCFPLLLYALYVGKIAKVTII